jgi:multiple sugar transport system permease protein
MSAISEVRVRPAPRARRRTRGLTRSALLYAGVGLILLFVLFPLYWIVVNSLKPEAELLRAGVSWLPSSPTLENYSAITDRVFPFGLYMRNSFIIAAGTVVLSVFVAVNAGYAFSRFEFRGKQLLMLIILMIYLIPQILLLVPLWVIMRDLGLLESPLGVILAHSTNAIPFAIWMLTGYFNELPRELEEAAWVDGANRLQALRHVILPLAVPGLIVTALFAFIASWNEFLYASSILRAGGGRTLPVGLWTLMSEAKLYWGQLTAGGVLATLPVAILFVLFQTYIVRGLTQGAVKG